MLRTLFLLIVYFDQRFKYLHPLDRSIQLNDLRGLLLEQFIFDVTFIYQKTKGVSRFIKKKHTGLAIP
jgi:hypothetical protein